MRYLHRVITAAMAAMLIFTSAIMPAQAASYICTDVTERQSLPVVSNETEGWPQGPVTNAQSAVLMEASTGTVLYEKNAHDQLYPASITKILTTLVALENSSLDDTVTFSYDSLHKLDADSSIIGGVEVGDTMTMEQILYGIMICSGNDAAYAAAEHVAGSVDAFVDMMNERATQIGCTDTSFDNPHGLPNENHVTSAMDMAKITRAALSNASFYTIATTRRYVFPPTRSGEERPRLNHHLMMSGFTYAYDGVLGGKTGYTSKAGSTLVTFAQRDGMTLICVVMNEDAPDQYLDTTSLLDYGFGNFRKVDMSNYGLESSEKTQSFFLEEMANGMARSGLTVKQSGTAVLPVTASVNDVTSTASSDGTPGSTQLTFDYNGTTVGSASMIIYVSEGGSSARIFGGRSVSEDTSYDVLGDREGIWIYIRIKYLLIAAAVIAAIACIFALYKVIKEKKRRRTYSGGPDLISLEYGGNITRMMSMPKTSRKKNSEKTGQTGDKSKHRRRNR